MRPLFTLYLCLWLGLSGRAQERVRNVRLRVVDSTQLEIRYDLLNTRPGDSVYVAVRSRLRGPLNIRPEFVRGDVGRRVVAGSDRRIVWDALANGYSLNEEVRATVLVKAGLGVVPPPPRPTEPVAVARPAADRPPPNPAERSKRADSVAVQPRPAPTDAPAPAVHPTARSPESVAQPSRSRSGVPAGAVARPDAAQPDVARPEASASPDTAGPRMAAFRKKRYAGPAWALLSAVAPGFGNIFVQTPTARIGFRPLLAVGCYGLLVYGLRERQQSRDAYAVYQEQKNAEMAEPYYRTANNHHHRYYVATRGAIVVAAADVMLTFFKGLRNGRAAAANRPVSPVSLRPGLQAGQLTTVVRYSF